VCRDCATKAAMIGASAMKRQFGAGEVGARMNKMARTNVSADVMAFMQGGGQPVGGVTVEDFVRNNNLDDRAANDLLQASPEVQMSVMARGDLSGTRNPSSAVIGRIRDAIKGDTGGGVGAGPANEHASLLAMLAGAGGQGQASGNDSFDQLMAAALAQSQETVPNVVIAYVAQSVPDQGYTLVAEDLSNPASNVYILNHQICNAAALSKAKGVAFQPSVNEMGQLVVTAPLWLLCGKLEDGKPVSWCQNVGSLGMPSPSGDIFVRCPEVKTKFGRAPYVFSKVVEVCGLEGGDEICFDVHVSPKGLPQVSAPVWRKHVEGEAAQAAARAAAIGPPTQDWEPKGKGGGKGMTQLQMNGISQMKGKVGKGDGPPADVRDGPGIAKQFDASLLSIAILKKTIPEKGFSLLTCDPSDESNEIYIHKSVASPEALTACSAVAFRPHTNAKGQMQASAPVWLLNGTEVTDAPVSWGAYMGTIAELSTFGDGFVHCPEAKEEFLSEPFIFRKLMATCGLEEGDEVCFDVTLSASGKPQVGAPIWKKNNDSGKGGDKGFGKGGMAEGFEGKGGKDGKGKGGSENTMEAMMAMMAAAKGAQQGGKGKGGSWQQEESWQGGEDFGKGGGKGDGNNFGFDKFELAAELIFAMADQSGGDWGGDGGWGGGGWGGGW